MPYLTKSPSTKLQRRSRKGVGFSPLDSPSLLFRCASHGFILSVALVAVFASGVELPALLSEGSSVARLEAAPSWPQFPRAAPFLDAGQQYVRKSPVPVTEYRRPDTPEQERSRPQIRQQVQTYKVEPGDTISQVAVLFGVTTQTVVWANDIANPDRLKQGQELQIPPSSGVLHTVKSGDTLAAIAQKYHAEVDAIVGYGFNSLQNPDTLDLGQQIMVPGGVKPAERPVRLSSDVRPKAPPPGQSSSALPPDPQEKRGSLLQWPTYGPIFDWFRSSHKGIDISPPYGTPVYAAEAGVIESVKYLNFGYGFFVLVNHGDGYQTRYAHLSEIVVKPGQQVVRGQHIGRVGSTGRVTGPHLHFEVIAEGAALDPLVFLPR